MNKKERDSLTTVKELPQDVLNYMIKSWCDNMGVVRKKRDKMKCKKCEGEGRVSMVYPGHSTTTCVYRTQYYDEADNPNKTTTHYTCSNGHKWTEVKWKRSQKMTIHQKKW